MHILGWKCILLLLYITDGERADELWGNSSPEQAEGTTAWLIISALRCWSCGWDGWTEFLHQGLACFQQQRKELFSHSQVPAAPLSEDKQLLLAAFYFHHRNSRGGLSFSSTFRLNGKPYVSGRRHNICCHEIRAVRPGARGDNGRLPSFSQHPHYLPLEPFATKNDINTVLPNTADTDTHTH